MDTGINRTFIYIPKTKIKLYSVKVPYVITTDFKNHKHRELNNPTLSELYISGPLSWQQAEWNALGLPMHHKTWAHKEMYYQDSSLHDFERKEKGYQLKSAIKLCHPAKDYASLCATVSKRHGVGSSRSIGFDLLTARCL